MSEAQKPVVYYIYDALCGWCYGFSKNILEFYENHKEEFDFQVFSGGMVTGEREGTINEVASYIKTAYKNVEETTGVKFGKNFIEKTLEEGTAYYSSVPAALAMALFRTQKPESAIQFAARIQKAIYEEGLPPAELDTYGHCVKDFGLDPVLFQQKMEDPVVQNLVQEEFKTVSSWGIKGFPSLVYMDGKHAYMIARGYTPMDLLEETLQNVREEIKAKTAS